MLKSLYELKVGDTLIHYKTKEKLSLEQIIPKDETEGTNYYFPLLGYVRDQCMRKMFIMETSTHFIVS
jgi:hypothetical protein